VPLVWIAIALGLVGLPRIAAAATPATPVSGTASGSGVLPSAPAPRSEAELQKLAAPIALYPDPVIAMVLPAAVYPVEIVQAARFVKDTNNIPKIDQQSWDDKVKDVARFPSLIARMDTNLEWTVNLGQAFIEQPMDLMNAIQTLRARARTAGKLKTTPQQTVSTTNAVVERMYQGQVVNVTNAVIIIQPASTNVIYLPSYNPTAIFVEDEDEDDEDNVTFAVGVAWGATWGCCDWWYGGCYWGPYPPPPPYYPPPYWPPPGTRPPEGRPPGRPTHPIALPPTTGQLPVERWKPDPNRLSSSGAGERLQNREARGWGNTGNPPSRRAPSGAVSARQPASLPANTSRSPMDQPVRVSPSAFSGVNNNSAATRAASSRGAMSRGGGMRGGGRR